MKGAETIEEIRTQAYEVRIHGQISQEKMKAAAESYAKKWMFRRDKNEKKEKVSKANN